MNMNRLESQLLKLIAVHDWKKIIQLSDDYSIIEKSRFLWAWPTEKCLQELKAVLTENCVESVLSIGCGSGLLEWIIEEMMQIPVSGVERNHSMWTTKYSPSIFIKVRFIDGDPRPEYLQNCAVTTDHFALLFCYFNNRSAFDKYIDAFLGDVVLIVGPQNDRNIVTDPLPMNPKFTNGSKWSVKTVINIDDYNVIAVYRRLTQLKKL
ncbi:hypothetical protein HA402_015008 [Bradysia odoriphaga]|nr:hypothetical protein HA402_015008 [Bradysia odoriphaga]